MFDFDIYDEDGNNLGKDYKFKRDEYGQLDFKNKRLNLKKIPPPDDKIVKKFAITFKGMKGAVSKRDHFTGRYFVDNGPTEPGFFKGTEKELSKHLDGLIARGYNIRDIYEND